MQNKDFDEIMDTWADHETESAPKMRPTADMYRLVQARQKRTPAFFVRSRWAVMGAAVASLVAILYVALFRGPQSGQDMAWVGQREGFGSGQEIAMMPGTRAGKGPILFGQLVFHFQRQDSRFIQGVDLQTPPSQIIPLTPADNYRLFLEPAVDCYVYVFQLTASGDLAKLFPNKASSPVQNPLRRGQMYYLPPEPDWFYLNTDAAPPGGQEHLYIVISAQHLEDLTKLYARHSQTDDESDKQAILASLIAQLDAIKNNRSDEANGWMLILEHQ